MQTVQMLIEELQLKYKDRLDTPIGFVSIDSKELMDDFGFTIEDMGGLTDDQMEYVLNNLYDDHIEFEDMCELIEDAKDSY